MIVVDDIPSAPFPNRSRSPVVQRLARSVVAGLIVWGGLAEEQPAARPDFQRDIAPILTRRCSECHGPDQQKAGLRLDSRDAALKGGKSGQPALAPGRSDGSSLFTRVVTTDPADVMPPQGDRLTAEQVSLLKAWIDTGAEWPDADSRRHWAFLKPERPAPPRLESSQRTRHPIDAFVLAPLEREGLEPASKADRTTLIRRLSLDLIGLPPTIAEVDAFLADRQPGAYERLVERLLASPHYGEKWGRHWLDAARYADTHGYEKDQPRTLWPYRDWVINAFNQDLPFDQFTIDQLAGDLVPEATPDQIIATGFLRNSMFNEEGGVDPEQFRVDSIVDRVDTVGKAFLGLTIACAQCHTHKYDPITQREYYRFFAFLNNDDEPDFEVLTVEQRGKRRAILDEVATLERQALRDDPDLNARLDGWERDSGKFVGDWKVLPPDDWHGQPGIKLERMSDDSLIALAHNPGDATYVVTFRPGLSPLTALKLEAIPHPNQRSGGPGRSESGNFVLSELTATLATHRDDESLDRRLAWRKASASFEQPGFPVGAAIDGTLTNKTGWAIDAGPHRRGRPQHAVFEFEEPLTVPTNLVLHLKLEQKHGGAHVLGRFRILATTVGQPPQADPVPPEVRRLLARPAAQRTPEEQLIVFGHYRTTDTNFAALNQRIDELFKEWPTGPRTLVLANRVEDRRVTRVFARGDFKQPTEAVEPGFPEVLSSRSLLAKGKGAEARPIPGGGEEPATEIAHATDPDSDPATRLDLARWIVSPGNPLTARVIMNRVWQAYFGQGLVVTAEDFGTRADPPSHPELLDWLATEFVRQNWSLKAMHRLMVTSATYRQSSRVTPDLLERDPYNRWLARGARFRVEAEGVRDIALAASGLLSHKLGGPSIFPPIPEGVMSLGYGAPMEWKVSPGEDKYRRGLYVFWKRTVPYPGLSVFDAPNADFGCVRRAKSNTPLQALTTLNDAVFHEAAQALALRTVNEGGASDRERVRYAFRRCTGRQPTPIELETILEFLRGQERYFENRTAAAVRVASPDAAHPPADVNLHRVAAWTMVDRTLLNLDETLTRQ
ncbi:MAG: PSD1 and planctomycete cytochrome C domain-containing protein [Limisphaerales bacterium]